MTQPYNSIKLPVDADLSSCSMSSAIETSIKKMIELKWTGGQTQRVLRIPSQAMGWALMLRVENDFYIEPSFTYEPDEWSYHCRQFNTETREHDEIIIWSPGA